MTLEELRTKIGEHIREKGQIIPVEGVFHDIKPNIAYVEDTIRGENGVETKFYGCSYLWKLGIDSQTIDSIATVKRVLMSSIRFALKHPVLSIPLLLLAHKDILNWFYEIYEADLKKRELKFGEFAPFPREIIRAGQHDKFFTAIAMFLQFDSGYYFRVQDILSNLDQSRLKDNPRKEVLRLVEIGISRENTQVKAKLEAIKRFISLAMLVPSINTLITRFLLELDVKVIQPDESDIYFGKRRVGYDYGGNGWFWRDKETQEKDIKLGHAIIIAEPTKDYDPNGHFTKYPVVR